MCFLNAEWRSAHPRSRHSFQIHRRTRSQWTKGGSILSIRGAWRLILKWELVYIGETTANGQFKILETFPQIVGEIFVTETFLSKRLDEKLSATKLPFCE